MNTFSSKSLKHLRTCDKRLQLVAHEALRVFDFSVIEGARSHERQKQMYDEGNAITMNSMHLRKNTCSKSRAFDLLPYPFSPQDWYNREKFAIFAGVILGIAFQLEVPLIWGGDWNRTFNPKETQFYDAMHFQLDEHF